MTAIQNVKGNSTEVRENQKVTIWIQEETNKPVSTSNKPFFNSGENGILDRIAEMFQTAKETKNSPFASRLFNLDSLDLSVSE